MGVVIGFLYMFDEVSVVYRVDVIVFFFLDLVVLNK